MDDSLNESMAESEVPDIEHVLSAIKDYNAAVRESTERSGWQPPLTVHDSPQSRKDYVDTIYLDDLVTKQTWQKSAVRPLVCRLTPENSDTSGAQTARFGNLVLLYTENPHELCDTIEATLARLIYYETAGRKESLDMYIGLLRNIKKEIPDGVVQTTPLLEYIAGAAVAAAVAGWAGSTIRYGMDGFFVGMVCALVGVVVTAGVLSAVQSEQTQQYIARCESTFRSKFELRNSCEGNDALRKINQERNDF